MVTNSSQALATKEMVAVADFYFNVGDVCYLSKPYITYNYIIITAVSDSVYSFYTSIGTNESCHKRSLMALYLQLIASNMQSIEEAQSLYPEYFV